jgi:hypothetical protein
MKKNRINTLITIVIIIAILSFSVYVLIKDNTNPSQVTEELAKCIGQNSELYVQTGCSACAKQEELFGANLKYLNSTDCFIKEERQICVDKNIEVTPTWIIKDQEYRGVQSIEKLKSLTGC